MSEDRLTLATAEAMRAAEITQYSALTAQAAEEVSEIVGVCASDHNILISKLVDQIVLCVFQKQPALVVREYMGVLNSAKPSAWTEVVELLTNLHELHAIDRVFDALQSKISVDMEKLIYEARNVYYQAGFGYKCE